MVKNSYGIGGNELKISDKYCGIKIIETKFFLDELKRGRVVIPNFQRTLQENKITDITIEFINRFKNNENYFIKHGYTISLCKVGSNKKLYVIDGQHRLESLKRLYKEGYNPDIIVRIQICEDLTQMKHDFALLNSNSLIPLIYTDFKNEFIQNMIIEVRNKLKENFEGSFNRSKKDTSNSNRLHMDDFLNLFQIDKIEEKSYNTESLYDEIIAINDEVKTFFDILPEENKFYINGHDQKVINNNHFYLSLKNIKWIHKLYFPDSDIEYLPVNYKKTKIPKTLRKKVLDRDIGIENYIGCCFVCSSKIDRDSAHLGHIQAEYLGGLTTLDNLKAICSHCNLSMGTKNLYVFKESHFS